MAENWTPEGSIYLAPKTIMTHEAGHAVHDFQDQLEQIKVSPVMVVNVPELIAQCDANPGKSTTQKCTEQVTQMVRGEINQRWWADSEEAAATLFGLRKVMVSRTSIAETSAHQVFFAKLSGSHQSVRVAIKPFEDEPEKAIREWVNMGIAQERGLDVFRPLGFVIGPKGYMVTERADNVDPMDNASWTSVMHNPNQHQELVDDLVRIGPVLGRVHNKGCYHGDTQMKNLIITQDNKVHLIDWEAATFIDPSLDALADDIQEPRIQRKAVHDLTVLFGSLARSVDDHGVGLLHGLTPVTQYDFFKKWVLTPYVEERLSRLGELQDIDHVEAVLKHIGEIEKSVSEYILNDELRNSLSRTRQSRSPELVAA